ncbi:MAG: bifunctional folylpolyglutamate synthase/dihydrofolate synthase [Bacteroidales bacterium]|nr:bifunctional folylpolyglutamate synthase/dihydrofolate synthase [Bacteroidales bacterium]
MDYNQTLHYLFTRLPMFQRIGAAAYKADLTQTIAICNKLGHPEKKFKSIHVAGTNGKGSVSHLIASILQEQGYRVGLYTSPHMKDFRERIKINGRKIPEKEVIDFVGNNQVAFKNLEPSFFEYTFGMAVKHFADENVDVAVMETGMGGRLDSTNVVDSVISIITNIGYDHMQFLGDTLSKIAAEKAGIIKYKIPVVIGQTQEETSKVFVKAAQKSSSEIYFADQNFKILEQAKPDDAYDHPLKMILQHIQTGRKIDLNCPLNGNYQVKNLITVLQSVEIIKTLGFKISQPSIQKGTKNVIKNTGLMGRWQVIARKPLTICDAAHNADGMKEVINQISRINFDKLHFVLGVVNDKNIEGLLQIMPANAMYYFCKADIPRGLDANQLKDLASKYGLKGLAHHSVQEALISARNNSKDDDLIFITGSTFVVAEVV